MASQTAAEKARRWPTKPYRPTPDQTADIRRRVHDSARRCREARIHGLPYPWDPRNRQPN